MSGCYGVLIHSFKTVLNKAGKVPAKRVLRIWGQKSDEAAGEVSQDLRSPWLLS